MSATSMKRYGKRKNSQKSWIKCYGYIFQPDPGVQSNDRITGHGIKQGDFEKNAISHKRLMVFLYPFLKLRCRNKKEDNHGRYYSPNN